LLKGLLCEVLALFVSVFSLILTVHVGARIKYKLMYYGLFLTCEKRQQSISCIGFPDAGIKVRHVDTRQYNDKAYNYNTYLNSGLLRAPHEYVLHGLVLGLD
jgi:hypothetical protein